MTIERPPTGDAFPLSDDPREPRSKPRFWLVLVVVALAISGGSALLALSTTANSQPATMRLISAQILKDDSEAIPLDTDSWQTQSLPDNWNRSRPTQGGFAWYRLSFDLKPEQVVISAIYIPRLSMNGMTYINGVHIGGDGNFAEPMSRQFYQPQLYSVPANLLRAGQNTIHVRIKAYVRNKGGLSEVYVGGQEAIAAQWKTREFWQIDSVKVTSTITLGLSLVALLVWAVQGWPSAYGYIGAAGMLWTAHNAYYLATRAPVAPHYVEVFAATSLMWTLILIFMFALRFAGLKLKAVERVVWLFAAAAPISLLAAGGSLLMSALGVIYLSLLLLGGYLLKVLLDVAMRERTVSTYLLFLASIAVYTLAAIDWIAQRGTINYSWYRNLHFGAPILFAAVALNLFSRFGEAQGRARELTQSLDARVQQKTRELEVSHTKLRAIEATQAQSAERARIMQDMHDGLGSQLVSSLALAQGGELSPAQTYELLRGCIDDLRLAIDTSTDSRDSLPLALGNLRFRMEPRLKCAGITLKWDTTKLQESLQLGVEQQLPLLRIIQETITNTLKHAQAQTLTVNVLNTPEDLIVDITDDGCGFDIEAARTDSRGKGLNSLNKRARALCAKLNIISSSQGTRTQLILPLTAGTTTIAS